MLLLIGGALLLFSGCGDDSPPTKPSTPPIPPPPAGLSATAGDAQIILAWSGASTATSYRVKRAAAAAGPFTVIATPAATGHTDTGLTNGTTYYYVVSSVNGTGESANSPQVVATPRTAALAAPTGLTATMGDNQAVLSWTAVSGATDYRLKRATANGGPYSTVAITTVPGYTDTGLGEATSYFYVVTARRAGSESPDSAQANGSTGYFGEPVAGWGAHVFRWWSNYDYQDFAVSHIRELHRSVHRCATEALGAQSPGSALNSNATHLRRYLDTLQANGQKVLITFAGLHSWTQPQVENQVEKIVSLVVSSHHTGEVISYEGVNEPDNNSLFNPPGSGMQRLKSFQQWMWNKARAVDPDCHVGLSPITLVSAGYNGNDTDDTYVNDMLKDTADGPSVLRYATHFSLHSYDRAACEFTSTGASNPSWVGRLWSKMQENSPVGVKPIWVTEGGYNSNFFFNGATPAVVRTVIDYRKYTSLVHYQWVLGMARLGVQRAQQYALAKDPAAAAADKGNNIWFYPGEGSYNPPSVPELGNLPAEPDGPREFIYYEMMVPYCNANAFQFGNLPILAGETRDAGNFDRVQVMIDGYTQLYPWHIVFDSRPAQVASGDPPFLEWESTVNSFTAGEPRNASPGCLRMTARANRGRNKAWRLVSNLARGRSYTVAAQVKVSGNGKAALKACGIAATPASSVGDIVTSQTADTGGQYVKLTLPAFTLSADPDVSNNWVVIELDHDGVGTIWWDDVTITES